MGVLAILKRFACQKKGAIAVLTALTIPVFIAGLAFAVDFSVWCLQSTRLQSAADAAALGASYLLEDSSLELQSSSTQQADFLSSAQVELDGASNNEHMIGTLSKPITVTWSWTSQSATVTLAS
jgi:Flp pilus assembly protein TadG